MRNLDKPQCKINVLNAEISFSEAKTLTLLIPLGLWQIGNTQITNKTTGVEICGHSPTNGATWRLDLPYVIQCLFDAAKNNNFNAQFFMRQVLCNLLSFQAFIFQ